MEFNNTFSIVYERFKSILESKSIKKSQLREFSDWLLEQSKLEREFGNKELEIKDESKDETEREDCINIQKISVECEDEIFYDGKVYTDVIVLDECVKIERTIEKRLEKKLRDMFGDADISVSLTEKTKKYFLFELVGDLQLVYEQKGINDLVV